MIGSIAGRGALPAVAAVLAIAAASAVVAAGPDADGIVVAAGFDGRWQVGAWTPLVVSATQGVVTPGRTVHVWAEDMDGQLVRSPPAIVEPVGTGAEARLCVRFGRPSGRYRLEVAGDGGGVTTTRERSVSDPIPSTARVVLSYADLPAVARATRLVDRDQGTSTAVVADAPPYAARSTARAFDAADAIIVSGAAVDGLPAAVLEGIDAWVRCGGRLVFLCGESAADVAQRESVARHWLPGTVNRLVACRRFGAIEAYARVGGLADRLPHDGLRVPRFERGTSGVVDVAAAEAADGLPLVVRSARGFGTVTWIGADLDREPLRGWAGAETLLAAALAGRSRGGLDARPVDVGATPDLAGQLHAALDTFAAVARPAGAERSVAPVPFELIAGLGVLYVLCLYPLDWWFVSRQGRPWLAWITLPLAAGGFTAAAWLVKDRWNGGRIPVARAADVIDVDAAEGMVRGTSWLCVHSPANERIDAAAEPGAETGAASAAAAVTWWAVAGRGFGGLDSPVPHPSLAAADYRYADTLAALDRVPVAAGGSRLFEADWAASAARPCVTSDLVRTAQGTLAGGVSHGLPFVLDDCRLLHAGWLYDVGRFAPGERYDTAVGRGPRSLASALTRRAAAKDRESALRWDATGTDVARILEVAGLHAAAGGHAYTGLDAGRLGRLDLSPLLAVDRAVLVGTVADQGPATRWRVRAAAADVAPAAAAATLCRIVIPLPAESRP